MMSLRTACALSCALLFGAAPLLSGCDPGIQSDSTVEEVALTAASVCEGLFGIDLLRHIGGCDLLPTAAIEPVECQVQMQSCSAAELRQIHAFGDCVEALPQCQRGGEATFQQSVGACEVLLPAGGCR